MIAAPVILTIFRSVFVEAPVSASVFDKVEVQSLIMGKLELPVPPDYNDIINVLEWWGRSISGSWQQELLKLLFENGTKISIL